MFSFTESIANRPVAPRMNGHEWLTCARLCGFALAFLLVALFVVFGIIEIIASNRRDANYRVVVMLVLSGSAGVAFLGGFFWHTVSSSQYSRGRVFDEESDANI